LSDELRKARDEAAEAMGLPTGGLRHVSVEDHSAIYGGAGYYGWACACMPGRLFEGDKEGGDLQAHLDYHCPLNKEAK